MLYGTEKCESQFWKKMGVLGWWSYPSSKSNGSNFKNIHFIRSIKLYMWDLGERSRSINMYVHKLYFYAHHILRDSWRCNL